MKDTSQLKIAIEELKVRIEELIKDEQQKSLKVTECAASLEEMRKEVQSAEDELNEAKRSVNACSVELQETRRELSDEQSLLERFNFDNAVEAFLEQQEDFKPVFERILMEDVEAINAKAKFSKPIDAAAALKSIYRRVENQLDFSDLTLAFRAAKTRYEEALRNVAELTANGEPIPVSVSLKVFEPIESFVQSSHLRMHIGIR